MAREQDGVVVEDETVPEDVKQAARVLHSWFQLQMYGERSMWNSGNDFFRMLDAAEFINQFTWEEMK